MYKIKKPNIIKFMFGDNKSVSEKLGLNNSSLCRILKGKQTTKYLTAYCIVKLYDPNKEVLDYFKKID
jgi:hypothetical protein